MKERIKKLFPALIPIVRKLKLKIYYLKMKIDKNTYSKNYTREDIGPLQFEDEFVMINDQTGFPIEFQENKVFNLKLAAKKFDNLIIKPGETFSFWKIARDADKFTPYKDGLVVVDGNLTTAYAGGLCHISNLLCWLFLHTKLEFVERTGHKKREFPNPPDILTGVDATIMEGLIDLKVKNATNFTYKIQISFIDDKMIGKIFTTEENPAQITIENKNIHYYENCGKIFEEVDIYRNTVKNKQTTSEFLYKNICEIGYQLDEKMLKGAFE